MKKDAASQSILESTVCTSTYCVLCAGLRLRGNHADQGISTSTDIPGIFRPLTRRPLPGFSLARNRKSGFDGTHPQPCGTLPVCVHEIARRGKP